MQLRTVALKNDFQLLGRPLLKLDLSWPKNPEDFTGEVFGVAVNHVTGLVYVAQVRMYKNMYCCNSLNYEYVQVIVKRSIFLLLLTREEKMYQKYSSLA